MVSRTGGGVPRCQGCKGRRQHDRSDKLAVHLPRNNHCCPGKPTKPMAMRKGSVSGYAVQLAVLATCGYLKPLKLKMMKNSVPWSPWAHLPGSVATRGQWLPNQTAKTQSAPTVAESSAGLRGSRRGCASGSEHESLTER